MLRNFNLVIVLLFISLLSGLALAQETIKVDTTLVSVPVIVSDRNGRYLGGLKETDFTLYQDGVKQQIDFFAATEEPFTVALMLDTSQSTARVLDDIKHAAKEFLKNLRPQDRAMIVSFDYQTEILCQLTSDRKALEWGIAKAIIGQDVGTVMRDAVSDVIQKHLKPIRGRKAIILLTDGEDHGSYLNEQELIDLTEESDTMIYPIFFMSRGQDFARNGPPPRMGRGGFGGIGMGRRGGIFGPKFPNPDRERQRESRRQQRRQRVERRYENAIEYLEDLAASSAGRFYRSDVADLKKTYNQIADELRHQYRLGFYPSEEKEPGKLHSIKVEVSPRDVVVRARKNYRLVAENK